MNIVFSARCESDTQRLGAALAESLSPGTVIALEGTLGAGKTRLVQGVAAACGVAAGEVVSPTFVLLQHYRGRFPIHHFDAYRLRDEDEFEQLGPEEYFDSAGVTFIEWASRVAGSLPSERLTITIHVTGPTTREFVLHTSSPRFFPVLEKIAKVLNG